MKKFIALFMAPVAGLDEMRKTTSPQQTKEWNEAWAKWAKSHEKSFVDRGAPAGKNKRVTKDSVRDVRNEVTGYSIVQADSHAAATQIFQDNPMLEMPGSYVEVLEYVEMTRA